MINSKAYHLLKTCYLRTYQVAWRGLRGVKWVHFSLLLN
jgi:hypothetical protein